jgi:hypothetical protein
MNTRCPLIRRTIGSQKKFGGFWRKETSLVASSALIITEIISPSVRKHTELVISTVSESGI